jgi:hypothetical protein
MHFDQQPRPIECSCYEYFPHKAVLFPLKLVDAEPAHFDRLLLKFGV